MIYKSNLANIFRQCYLLMKFINKILIFLSFRADYFFSYHIFFFIQITVIVLLKLTKVLLLSFRSLWERLVSCTRSASDAQINQKERPGI